MASRSHNLSMTSAGLAVLVVVGGAVWFGTGSSAGPGPSTPVPVPPPAVESSALLVIHVSGSVARAGVVRVAEGSRVADVIAAAGGATPHAELGAVNLAALVRDGEHVQVPSIHQPDALGASNLTFDLNTADVSVMQELPGVGPVLAARIVAFRDDHGPFESIEALLDVPGIGESKLASIRAAIEDM